MDRAEALKGADVVLVTILAGGVDVWRHDIEIPKKYGVDTNIGDTRGPSGIFRALRTIPVMLEHRPRYGALLPRRDHAQLHQPDGDAVPRHAARNQHPADRAVPQRPGHSRDAGALDRRADGRDHLHLRRHQPHGLVSEIRVERQGCLSADPPGDHRAARGLQRGAGAQRDVPGARLLRDRVQRAQLRVQLVVPQAPRPDREVLHPRHRLEPRRVCLHHQALRGAREHLARRREEVVRLGQRRSRWSAATSTPPISSMRCRAASRSSSTAMCPTPG